MSAVADATTAGPTVSTSTGTLRGSVKNGIERYLGIPYAAAPVGEHRFALPAPVTAWDGVRSATQYGPTAPQAPYAGGLEALLPTVLVPGDEFLNLNVWTPAERTPGLPVMVWVHGGSLAHGANGLAGYDGSTFARDGIVFVSINYRLGAEGFSVLEGAPLNLGLADQFAALRWVQREIAAFGGDPRQVTVFGQSAGANTLAAILAHPEAPTLFSRAILQSGPLSARPRAAAGKITQLMAKHLGISTTRGAFSAKTPGELVAAQKYVTAGTTPITGGPGFALAIGEDLVPQNPEDALLNGAGNDIPLLIGTTTEEYRLWFAPTGLLKKLSAVHLAAARLKFRIGSRMMRPYRANRPGASPAVLLGALATDLLLRIPANRVADSRRAAGAETHVYEFAWKSPVKDLGAAHAVELGFVFDGIDSTDSVALAGPDAPRGLATEMHDAWVAFAKTGDPGWELWDPRRPVRVFDSPATETVLAPREDEREVWK